MPTSSVMRLIFSPEVVRAAGPLVREVVEAYASPVLTFDQLREKKRVGIHDLLKDFGNACRAKLHALGSSSAWLRQGDVSIHAGDASAISAIWLET